VSALATDRALLIALAVALVSYLACRVALALHAAAQPAPRLIGRNLYRGVRPTAWVTLYRVVRVVWWLAVLTAVLSLLLNAVRVGRHL